MNDRQHDARQRIIDGNASAEEAEAFIVDLESALESTSKAVDDLSAKAVSALDRLARHKNAAAELTRAVPKIAGEDDRLTRLELAQEAIEQHERSAGE